MSVLLVTASRDLAVDIIVVELRRRGVPYLRLDLDLLREDEVSLDPIQGVLRQELPGGASREVVRPISILYRAPTHLRESSGHRYAPDELLARHQWAAFARSLAVFRSATWINHPVATYAGENKPYQLVAAREAGLRSPRTVVTNTIPREFAEEEQIAVKALDSFLLRRDQSDLFFYTSYVRPGDLRKEECQEMPMIMQQFVHPKTDLRVTVVGDKCFPAETVDEVEGDWRLQKERVHFRLATLPDAVTQACIRLVRDLGLIYGAIDLARTSDGYWFFEINPTGEWAWVDEVFGGGITEALVVRLVAGPDHWERPTPAARV